MIHAAQRLDTSIRARHCGHRLLVRDRTRIGVPISVRTRESKRAACTRPAPALNIARPAPPIILWILVEHTCAIEILPCTDAPWGDTRTRAGATGKVVFLAELGCFARRVWVRLSRCFVVRAHVQLDSAALVRTVLLQGDCLDRPYWHTPLLPFRVSGSAPPHPSSVIKAIIVVRFPITVRTHTWCLPPLKLDVGLASHLYVMQNCVFVANRRCPAYVTMYTAAQAVGHVVVQRLPADTPPMSARPSSSLAAEACTHPQTEHLVRPDPSLSARPQPRLQTALSRIEQSTPASPGPRFGTDRRHSDTVSTRAHTHAPAGLVPNPAPRLPPPGLVLQ